MGDRKNLLRETLAVLKSNNKTKDDVQWVGSIDGSMALDFDSFAMIAKDTEYNSGFGGQEIASDLSVVGRGWWLERHEYDGSEWWEFKECPERKEGRPFRVVTCSCGWLSLREMQRQAEEDAKS